MQLGIVAWVAAQRVNVAVGRGAHGNQHHVVKPWLAGVDWLALSIDSTARIASTYHIDRAFTAVGINDTLIRGRGCHSVKREPRVAGFQTAGKAGVDYPCPTVSGLTNGVVQGVVERCPLTIFYFQKIQSGVAQGAASDGRRHGIAVPLICTADVRGAGVNV